MSPATETIPAIDEAGRCLELARFCGLLNDPLRLRILRALDGHELRVFELVEATGRRQQAISHHLTILKLNGAVVYDRRQKTNVYRLTSRGRAAVETVAALRLA